MQPSVKNTKEGPNGCGQTGFAKKLLSLFRLFTRAQKLKHNVPATAAFSCFTTHPKYEYLAGEICCLVNSLVLCRSAAAARDFFIVKLVYLYEHMYIKGLV